MVKGSENFTNEYQEFAEKYKDGYVGIRELTAEGIKERDIERIF